MVVPLWFIEMSAPVQEPHFLDEQSSFWYWVHYLEAETITDSCTTVIFTSRSSLVPSILWFKEIFLWPSLFTRSLWRCGVSVFQYPIQEQRWRSRIFWGWSWALITLFSVCKHCKFLKSMPCDFSLCGVVRKKIILTLIKTVRQTLFRTLVVGVGPSTVGFCSRGEKLDSIPKKKTGEVGTYRQGTVGSGVVTGQKTTKRVGSFFAKLT